VYKNQALKKYTDDLAARLPAPGGGSCAALSACLGACLISMVVEFTLGKQKYARYHDRLTFILTQSEKFRRQLLDLVDLDVEAFKSKNLKKCLNVPLKTMELCIEAIRLCPDLIKMGNSHLLSDVAVAAVLIEAGFSSAYFNVAINLKYMKDPKLTKKLRARMRRNAKSVLRIRQQTEVKVGDIITG